MRLHRFTLLTATLACTVAVAPAFAHVNVKKTSPGKGKTVSSSIRSASVTFTGPIRSGTLKVVGPGNRTVSIGKGARDPRNVSRVLVGLKSGLKAGSYKASWTEIAADGHSKRGSFTFKVRR